MSFYQKYRPQKFSELVNQESTKSTLVNALKEGKISHAYLFAGPRGTGKTTVARILAKALNCEKGKDGEPCGKCKNCISIKNDSSLDLIEIDAASNRGIEEMRELRERTRLSPASAKYKIFIIDEAHMLTIEAFNALLKTLEEPPAHVIFILCTTEAHKLPVTILSRLQRFDFLPISSLEILKHLKKIAALEKIEIDDDALKLIVLESSGHMRDALSAFEMVASSSYKNNITLESVSHILGFIGIRTIVKFVDGLTGENLPLLIKIIRKISDRGYNPENFLGELIKYLRGILLYKIENGLPEKISELYTKEESSKIFSQAKLLSEEEIINYMEKILLYKNRLKEFPLAEIGLEVMAAELLLSRKSLAAHPHTKIFNEKNKSLAPRSSSMEVKKNFKEIVSRNKDLDGKVKKIEEEEWGQFLKRIKNHNVTLFGVLADVLTKEIQGEKLNLGVAFAFYKKKIEQHIFRAIIEKEAKGFFGKKLELVCHLKEGNLQEIKSEEKSMLSSVKEIFEIN